jgi:hypothetical protein
LTNFPLGSQFLSGLFLEMDVIDANGKTETYERTLVDRIGFAARQNGDMIAINIGNETAGQPTVEEFNITTVNVLPTLQSPFALGYQAEQVKLLEMNRQALLPQIKAINFSSPISSDEVLLQRAIATTRQLLVSLTGMLSSNFAITSDDLTARLASIYSVKAYFDRPRVIIVSTKIKQGATPQDSSLQLAIDLRNDEIRATPSPEQVANAPFLFHVARGISDNVIEREVLEKLVSLSTKPIASVNTASVFEAAVAQHIAIAVLADANIGSLTKLNFSLYSTRVRIALL